MLKSWKIYILMFVAILLAMAGCGSSGGTSASSDDDAVATDDTSADDAVGDDTTADDTADDDTAPTGPLTLGVMTFNIMFDFPKAGFDSWADRSPHEADIINYWADDLLGLQEPFPWQTMDLHNLCAGYGDTHFTYDPDANIFFLADRFEALETGHFWLSPHPRGISIGWGNYMPRLAVWAKLRDRQSGWTFLFVNTHFDNNTPFQQTAAPVFLSEIETLAGGLPVVVTGDFNSDRNSEAYRILTEGAEPGGFKLTDAYDLVGTYDIRNAPGDERLFFPMQVIDHIFMANGAWTASKITMDMTRYGDPLRDPADHFAISADIELPLP